MGDLKTDFEAVQDEFLKPLLEVLAITPDRVFIVPGNHEMDREAVPEADRIDVAKLRSKPPCEADVHEDLRTKLAEYFNFVSSEGYNSVTSSSPRLTIFEIDGQAVACLNGLVGSYSLKGADDKGNLFVLPSEYGGVLAGIPEFSLVLLHHPLSWFEDSCGSNLKEFLAARRCRLLTGHIHDQGLESVETKLGTLAVIQAGAVADVWSENQVAVGWYPPSNSAAVRHYTFDKQLGNFPITSASETRVTPSGALAYFQRSEAFFDTAVFQDARKKAAAKYEIDLRSAFGRDTTTYISPDLVTFTEDQFSAKRLHVDDFLQDQGYRVLSGDELSGKTSFVYYSATKQNLASNLSKISIVVDYRALAAGKDIKSLVTKELVGCGLSSHHAEHVISVGLVSIWFDNFDPDNASSAAKFGAFCASNPEVRWSVAVRGGQHFTPSRAPSTFPTENIKYYELSEITAPTVVKMIAAHDQGSGVERPRAVVERVFRSINNLRAPRTIFYVDNLVDMFLSDGSVEPLNRYLLIENLLSDKIRKAHREHLPQQAIDMDMLDTFIGQIAHHLLVTEQPYLSKADYYTLIDKFIQRKGLQRKRFQPESILDILLSSFVLREYDDAYGFMMLSVEDYYLAKHMGRDDDFRDQVMSPNGLMTLPSVAEYYIAQHPSDRQRVSEIFQILDAFEEEVWSFVESIEEDAVEAIRSAAPGSTADLQEELLSVLGDVEEREEGAVKVVSLSAQPQSLGATKRLRFSPEERGATLLQLGASILGVTRTLDQSDRIAIFERLRRKMLVCFYAMPFIAHHLAEGGEIKFRGITVRADFVGSLADKKNRFYIILRGMLYNSMKQFGTWAGSPSFFNAAVTLRASEENELIRAALFAQNIEADLSEAASFIPDLTTTLDSSILKEVVLRLYVDAMNLVPLERSEESRAIDHLVDATINLNPPEKARSASLLNNHKINVRQQLTDMIGINTYLGRLVKPKG